MKRKLICCLFLLYLSFITAQINDEIRIGADKKTSNSGSSSSSSSGSSSGVSSSDLSLLIDACGCLYNVGVPFFSEVLVKGIKNNTKYIKETHDSLPRIKNIQFNLGYGAYPDKEVVYFPKLRLQAGILGTSLRAQIIQDKKNSFLKDFLAFYDWQIVEFNYINTTHVTMRSGFGIVYFPNSSSTKSVVSTDFGTSIDFIFNHEKLRASVEGRITPFDGTKFLSQEGTEFKKEIGARLYFRPSELKRFKPELFAGGYYQRLFDSADLWKLEAGVGFILY